ncbi:carbohydrate ABC transporter permease [Pseudalkalibacillus caeni]|uniref:ABC transporter permease subunit n=1 Tax=Exobacillus caeni TaxID=2574798 RepID=A0A5R9F8J4_9BACL|nr:sugar ABC transporter permease [Pseudalkalibacillus caeni]TLS38849.1 ABC transporter permease subunit [Pseudalkalibacillus caeni]
MKTNINPNKPVKISDKPKKKRTDSLAGYLLVAPALILIFAIAIWPVFQSFYFSLFDLRLNDPTKSEVHLNYQIDLERYLQNYPFLIGTIDSEINKGNSVDELESIKDKLQTVDSRLQENPVAAERYELINSKLDNFEKVDEDLKVIEIEKDVAETYLSNVKEIKNEISALTKDGDLEQGDKILGLSKALDDTIAKPNFIGFKHYKDNFTDKRMWSALWNTTMFTVISVFVELLLGLAIALLINKAFIGRGLIRASILIPWAIPTAVSALMWKFLYDGQNGVVAKIFEEVGLVDSMSNLLTTDAGAMFSVIFADVWKTTPYMSLLLLAGLQTIPASLYEAASIDGASKWKQFITVTLPLLKSSILVALLFRTLDAFRVFDLIYVLTGGGPANSTETISILAYKVMFSQTNFGEGSALAVIVFICVAIISTIYIKFLGSDLLNDSSSK